DTEGIAPRFDTLKDGSVTNILLTSKYDTNKRMIILVIHHNEIIALKASFSVRLILHIKLLKTIFISL
ncbi:hypothetical protein OIX07_003606, partial [Acinetobacter baumannii]